MCAAQWRPSPAIVSRVIACCGQFEQHHPSDASVISRGGSEVLGGRKYQAASATAKWAIWSSYAFTKAGRAVARAT